MPNLRSGHRHSLSLSILRRTILQCTPSARESPVHRDRFCPFPEARASPNASILQFIPVQLQPWSATFSPQKPPFLQPQRVQEHISGSGAARRNRFFHRVIWTVLRRFQFHLDLALNGCLRRHTHILYVSA